jgi:hypothetical protein
VSGARLRLAVADGVARVTLAAHLDAEATALGRLAGIAHARERFAAFVAR